MKVTYEFDPFEDKEELAIFQRASQYHSSLWDISQAIRSYNKYDDPGDEAPLEEQLKKLKAAFERVEELVSESGIWES